MNDPYTDTFQYVCYIEVATLKILNTLDKVKHESRMNAIESTWTFKIKRFPTCLIHKFKARFCVRGDMQIAGVDLSEAFALVVNWATVQTLSALSNHLNLSTD